MQSILALRTTCSCLRSVDLHFASTREDTHLKTVTSTAEHLPRQALTLSPAIKRLRRDKILYWVLKLLMFVPGTLGAFAEAFTKGPASIVKVMLALGFPLYLMKILGVFKIFGGIAILTGRLPRMKEWAYAGFSIEFLGATAAHVITGDRICALFPFSFFLVLIFAYALWHKTAATPLPFEQPATRP